MCFRILLATAPPQRSARPGFAGAPLEMLPMNLVKYLNALYAQPGAG
jgi:hypothetical protein